MPPYPRTQHRGGSDLDLADPAPRERTDYAVREVDYYYGVRGPALSNAPARKLKTGPADPVGPVSSATTWFQRLVGGKRKDKGKGFEVVRSSRVPANKAREPLEDEEGQELQTSPPMNYLPYTDSPDPQSVAGARRPHSPEGYGDMGSRLGGTWNNMEAEESDSESDITDVRPSSPPYLRPISQTGSLNFDHDDMPVRAPSSAAAREYFPASPPPRHPFHVGNSVGSSGRPTSMGTVQQRVTSDSLFQSAVVGEGSIAEIVTNDRTMSMESRYAQR
jgi:hypothetical protein